MAGLDPGLQKKQRDKPDMVRTAFDNDKSIRVSYMVTPPAGVQDPEQDPDTRSA